MIELSFGNTKLPKTTMIFNMGAAEDCPSKKLGLCKVPVKCYALKAEQQYPKCLDYRRRQQEYWLKTDVDQIIADLYVLLERKKTIPTLLRFNEAGDFHSQDCVDKLSDVAMFLKFQFDIETYGYSARSDLDFSKAAFLVKASNKPLGNGNNGCTVVVPKGGRVPAGFVVCPGSCKSCTICSEDTQINVAFIAH